MDLFCEYIVKRKKSPVDYLITVAGYFAALILSYIFLMLNSLLFGFGLLLIAASWYGAYILMKSRYVEYEYTLTNSEMDIDKIYAKRRRKRLISVDFRHVDICAKIDDPIYSGEFKNNTPSKIYDVSGLSENDIYFVDFSKDASKVRVIFQPTDKMKDGLKLINPRVIHIL